MPPKEYPTTPRSANTKLLLVALGCSILGLAIGFGLGQASVSKSTSAPTIMNQSDQKSYFDNQSGTIQGQITQINGNKVLVTNQQNQVQEFELSNPITIYKYADSQSPADVYTDASEIELNKPALIDVQMDNGQYKIVIVTILAPATPVVTPQPTP